MMLYSLHSCEATAWLHRLQQPLRDEHIYNYNTLERLLIQGLPGGELVHIRLWFFFATVCGVPLACRALQWKLYESYFSILRTFIASTKSPASKRYTAHSSKEKPQTDVY